MYTDDDDDDAAAFETLSFSQLPSTYASGAASTRAGSSTKHGRRLAEESTSVPPKRLRAAKGKHVVQPSARTAVPAQFSTKQTRNTNELDQPAGQSGAEAYAGRQTGPCPICGEHFPMEDLERHVDDELNQMAQLEEEAKFASASADAADPTASRGIADGADMHQSIIISDGEHSDGRITDVDDWFDDRPSGMEILSQHLLPDDIDDYEDTEIQDAQPARSKANGKRMNDGHLSPLEGFVSLHEARLQWPEMEGYFQQFSRSTSDETSGARQRTEYTVASRRTDTGGRGRARAYNGRSRGGRDRGRARAGGRAQSRGSNHHMPEVNHYAGDPIVDADGLQWEGFGTAGYNSWGMGN
ncbi:hypothetical protein THASP1DRAFT_28844 [Thamnocephalis sphaerospora]|uniref:UBZ4-type domain-containing protein n=1 Tax=Thamnocephalis sphaerospora TaxID=78915 RepID=A0A4V1IX04_9FUNG|nr:hypothetical protein THASP1DRAFT_28844 [Thamnocephalis sphaerospora]|eukprot:RKP09369.1 hypothetical protein THASP1DRAFT_28844 [Thamnocephalis sphaerospora]